MGDAVTADILLNMLESVGSMGIDLRVITVQVRSLDGEVKLLTGPAEISFADDGATGTLTIETY